MGNCFFLQNYNLVIFSRFSVFKEFSNGNIIKNSKFRYILGRFPKIQTVSDFEKKKFRGYLDFYKNHSSVHEILTFYIFVNIKVKFGTFDAKKIGINKEKNRKNGRI